MLSEFEARKIGINACIDKLGREFVKQNATTASSAYGLRDNGFFCFVGVNDAPTHDWPERTIILTNKNSFPYHASCIVNINSGSVQFLDYMIP